MRQEDVKQLLQEFEEEMEEGNVNGIVFSAAVLQEAVERFNKEHGAELVFVQITNGDAEYMSFAEALRRQLDK